MPKCPVCGRTQSKKDDLIRHTEKEHMDEIPENMSTAQFIYFKTHGREYGLCRICGKPTEWNEKTGKPHQHCGSPVCKEKIKQIARERMVKIYGKPSLMKDIEHQEKMLAHRKISGTYIWSDGKHKFTYTGQYEKFAIEWLDKVMDLDPEHIQMPGPVLPYEFNGEIKYWITDIYLEDFNLIIEIKAGKDENTHPGFEHNRELEAAKDASMRNQNVYNYTKITHKSMMNLVKVCSEIRMVNLFSEKESKSTEPIVVINESFNSYDSEYSFFEKIFNKSKLIQSVSSVFHKVNINTTNHTIEIRGINYIKLIKHIKELYPNEKIYKIFEIIYNDKDWRKYENKKIYKNKMRIDYIHTYEFFALELIILFNDLYDKFKLSYYNKIADEIYSKTWVSREEYIEPEKINLSNLKNILLPLKQHQLEFIKIYPSLKSRLNLNGYILAFDQGLGKTLTAIALSECLDSDRIYIICPNSLKDNWALEIKKYFSIYKNEDKWKNDIYIQGSSIFTNIKDSKYIICNNESIDKLLQNPIPKSNKPMIILDESHNFRNINSVRTNNLIELKNLVKPNDCLIMSGTPIKASPAEICPALMMIDPTFTIEVAKVYSKCFDINNLIGSDIFKRRIGKIMYRKMKEEVLPDLPEKHISDLKLHIKNSNKYLVDTVRDETTKRFVEIYNMESKNKDNLEKEFKELIYKYSINVIKKDINRYIQLQLSELPDYELHEMDIKFRNEYIEKYLKPNPLFTIDVENKLNSLIKKFIHMRQSCMGKALGEILHPRRVELFNLLFDENKELIEDMIIDSSKKTIIFTPFVEVAKHIYKNLSLNSCLVIGETQDRLKQIMTFKEDSSVDVLVCTCNTLGTGHTLTEANLMFFFGTPWRSSDFDQCCDRIYRLGQTHNVNIYKILLDTPKLNLSTRLDDILSWSETMVSDIVVSTLVESIEDNISEYPSCKTLDKLFDFLKEKGCEIAYKKMPDIWKDSRKANGLPAPDELYKINYDGKIDGSICEILNNHGFSCYDKPRTSNPHYAKYKVDSLDNYKLDIYVNLISKRISISKFNTNYDGTSLSNTEIMSICESIMNEYTMSVANISPIVTNNAKYTDNESKEDTLLNRLRKVVDKTKHEVIEPQDPQSNIFSPNNTVNAPDPLVASNNFVENEEIRVDLETDPYNTKPNDFANISQSNIKSYF